MYIMNKEDEKMNELMKIYLKDERESGIDFGRVSDYELLMLIEMFCVLIGEKKGNVEVKREKWWECRVELCNRIEKKNMIIRREFEKEMMDWMEEERL